MRLRENRAAVLADEPEAGRGHTPTVVRLDEAMDPPERVLDAPQQGAPWATASAEIVGGHVPERVTLDPLHHDAGHDRGRGGWGDRTGQRGAESKDTQSDGADEHASYHVKPFTQGLLNLGRCFFRAVLEQPREREKTDVVLRMKPFTHSHRPAS